MPWSTYTHLAVEGTAENGSACHACRGDVSVMEEVLTGPEWEAALRHMAACTCMWTSKYRTAWQLFQARACTAVAV